MHHQEKKEKQVSLPPPCKKFLSCSKNKQKKTQKAKLIALLKRTLSRRDVNKNIDCGLSFRSRIGGAMESSDKSSIRRLYLLVQLLHLSPPCPISRHAPKHSRPPQINYESHQRRAALQASSLKACGANPAFSLRPRRSQPWSSFTWRPCESCPVTPALRFFS